MSVKEDNRPPNRFIILQKFNALSRDIMFELNSPDFDNRIFNLVTERLLLVMVDARMSILMFNNNNVYSDESYKKRRIYQDRFTESVTWIYSFFDMVSRLRVESNQEPKDFLHITKKCHEINEMMTKLIKTDDLYHTLGKKETQNRFNELRKRDFVEDKTYDNTKITESTMNSKDKFGLNNLVFKPIETKTDKNEF